MARKRSPSRDPHYWTQVRLVMFCNLGGHDVRPGAWVRLRRDDFRRLASCEECLKTSGISRPSRPFTSSAADSAIDVRALRSGESE
jgi:hypothetical protein